MNAHHAFGAMAALAVAAPVQAGTAPLAIDIGTFENVGGGQISYHGDFETYIWAGPAPSAPDHTLISVDLVGILSSLGHPAFLGVTITDTGLNTYGQLSPGADIDLFTFEKLSPDIVVTYVYDGPNAVHQDETSDVLAQRVAAIDAFPGAQDAWDLTHVSLGDGGSLTALFSGPQDIFNEPGAGIGPSLLMSEAGSYESFSVEVLVVPTPGTLALLGVAAVVARRRRRPDN